jgi:hypothetical protein
VPKKTSPFYRVIFDLRELNKHMAKWKSHMVGMAASAMIFNAGAVAWSRDIKTAYHTSTLAGCNGGGVKRDKTCMKAPGHARYTNGCTPATCTGICSKALMGLEWRGQYYRYTVPTFGSSCGGQILEALLQPLLRKLKTMGLQLLDWVDDMLFVVQNVDDPTHDPLTCGGEHGCKHCKATFEKARKLEVEVDVLLTELGFRFSDKNEPPAQEGEFLGLGWNTKRGVYVLSPAKADRLAAQAQDLLDCKELTPRLCAQFRGKMQWYRPCLESVALLTRQLNKAVSQARTADDWDLPLTLLPEAREELQFWVDNLPRMADVAKPMWQLTSQQMLERFQKGQAGADACLSTNASLHG